MKRVALFILSLIFINCASDDTKPKDADEPLLGKWKIIERLVDPGDGSGTFQSIDSERTIEFFNNATVTVNGVMCYMATEVSSHTTGTYVSIFGSDFNDGEITPPDCNYDGAKVWYKISGANLILWYQCIEGCGEKYIKVN